MSVISLGCALHTNGREGLVKRGYLAPEARGDALVYDTRNSR